MDRQPLQGRSRTQVQDGAAAVLSPLSARTIPALGRTPQQRATDSLGIVRDHAYSIEAVDTRAKTLNLRNPWGFRHLTNLPVAAFRSYFNTWSWVDVR